MTWEATEAAVVARLQAKLGAAVKQVFTASEFADVEESSQRTPFVAVIYGGYTPTQTPGGVASKIQEIEQTWLCVVCVRSARGTRLRSGAREDSAPIVRGVIEALIGWRPATDEGPIDGETPLRLAPAPEAQFSDAGFAYYPIAFTNRRTYRGTD